MGAYKNPPVLNVDDIPYEKWRREVNLWKAMTEVTKKRQGLDVALSFTRKYRDVATNIDLQSWDRKDGMETLLRKMDEKFKRDDIDCAFEYYQKFELFRGGN